MIKEYIVSITNDVDHNGFEQFENDYSPVQELVRCRDCKYGEISGRTDSYVVCRRSSRKIEALDWFCADGERRDDL